MQIKTKVTTKYLTEQNAREFLADVDKQSSG